MKKNCIRNVCLVGTSLFLIVCVFLFFNQGTANNTPLIVDFLDVGQGDSILLQTPKGQDILIDAGPNQAVSEKLGRYLPFFDRDIELLVITHAHADHYEGVFSVLRHYQIKKVLINDASDVSPSYSDLLEALIKNEVPIIYAHTIDTFQIEEALSFKIVHPHSSFAEEQVENINNTSIVLRLVYHNRSFLFMGDAEVSVENKLLAEKDELYADVLKVGHHGSDTSSSITFLKEVHPEYAIISVGTQNRYGHPSARVLHRLEGIGVKSLRTDLMGDISVITDGYQLFVLP